MLRLDGVYYTYSLPGGASIDALRGISLTIADGERVALVGANGSGKSTLARHLNGLLLPTRGDVYVNDINTRDKSQLQAIRQTVGIIFQDPDNQLVATVVEEDVAFGPENLGVPQGELQDRVTQALGAVDLAAERKRAPHLLSGGQRQRVAIAGILAMRPRVIVLDEATAMLDQEGMLHIVTRGLDSEHIHSWDYAFLLKTIQARRIAPLGVFAWLERARTARNLIETAD